MDGINLLVLFLFSVGLLWITLILATLYQTNTKRLMNKGYNDTYIAFFKEDHKKRALGIGILLPIIMVAAGLITKLIFHEFKSLVHFSVFGVIFLILVAPFPMIDARKTNRRLKELAIETDSEVVIDLNYNILRLVFKPRIELLAAIFYIVFFVIILKKFNPGLFFLVMPWFFYGSARSGRSMTRPLLTGNYMYAFILMTINHSIAIVYFIWGFFTTEIILGWPHYLTGGFLGLLLVSKLVYYFLLLPQFRLALKEVLRTKPSKS